jgi:23S rRNA (cytidine1920-2'-O)/16S rRNA (cytidine1409-2'-O)-methyltransferase
VRVDPRVTVMERTNLRYVQLSDLPGSERVDLATLDLSFISVVKVLPAICNLLSPSGELIILIKPQFEAGKSKVRAVLYL